MTFSSLDVHLHTEALLSTMNFLNNLLPKQEASTTEIIQEKEEKKEVIKKLSKFLLFQILAFLNSLQINFRCEAPENSLIDFISRQLRMVVHIFLPIYRT